jgi:hypothetical protein
MSKLALFQGAGRCKCGCGEVTAIATKTSARLGTIKGQPRDYMRGHRRNNGKTRFVVEDRGHETPCWVWQMKTDRYGYGHTSVRGKDYMAHRLYYERSVGPIPEGYVIDHLCCIKPCVNPDHLEAVTPSENQWRAFMTKMGLDQTQIESLRDWMIENLSIEQLEALWAGYKWHR